MHTSDGKNGLADIAYLLSLAAVDAPSAKQRLELGKYNRAKVDQRTTRQRQLRQEKLVPPYVATELMGDHQANDPRATPLAEFVTEVMEILWTQPEAKEICVKRVYPLRFAAEQGQAKYKEQFLGFNKSAAAAMKMARN